MNKKENGIMEDINFDNAIKNFTIEGRFLARAIQKIEKRVYNLECKPMISRKAFLQFIGIIVSLSTAIYFILDSILKVQSITSGG